MAAAMRGGLLLLLLAASLGAPPAEAAVHVPYVPASPANYSHHVRGRRAIRLIVVHVTEGTFASAVAWFRNPRAHASANYVVSRAGSITQMVPDWAVAWHSGNPWVNLHSIGIEHEGLSEVSGTFSDAEYRASAELVAGLMRRYVLPIDRRHVIGHAQVPDPFHAGLFGGASHHTDPGRFWDWQRYMAYVRSYARGITPPPPPFEIEIVSPAFGQVVSGAVPWAALVSGGTADHVDFSIDGRLAESETAAPYVEGAGAWNTGEVPNGRHLLRVRAFATDGSTRDSAIVVYVKNARIRIVGVSVEDGATVSGVVHVDAKISGSPVRVEFLLDGQLRDTETTSPYSLGGAGGWDTTRETPGPHTLVVRAIGPHQNVAAARTVHVTVASP